MIKKFKLAGKEYRIKEGDDKLSNCLGMARSPVGEILIAKKWDGDIVPDDSKAQTVCHEIVHCILDEMGIRKQENEQVCIDERFVQMFGVYLYEVWTTAK